MNEKELDMNELINSFDEYSTDYTKTACTYYGDYLRNYQKEKIELQQENKQLKKAYDKEKYLTDKLTKQLTDEYKNTEIQYKLKNEYKNIIDELEKWLKGYWELLSGMPDIQEQAQMDILHEVSDKIKELKGNNNGKN